MKKLYVAALLTISLLLTACGTSNTPETENDLIAPPIEKTLDSTESQNDPLEEITQSGPCGTICLSLPKGWSYIMRNVDDEKLTTCDYGIQIRPDDAKSGYVEIGYSSTFGLCGTGLETKYVTLSGKSAEVCYYDKSPIWSFVIFGDTNHTLIASTIDTESWWDTYENELMSILDSVRLDNTSCS